MMIRSIEVSVRWKFMVENILKASRVKMILLDFSPSAGVSLSLRPPLTAYTIRATKWFLYRIISYKRNFLDEHMLYFL